MGAGTRVTKGIPPGFIQSLVVTSLQLWFPSPAELQLARRLPLSKSVQADDSASVFSLSSACQLVRKQDAVVESDNTPMTPMQYFTVICCCIKCYNVLCVGLCISEKLFRHRYFHITLIIAQIMMKGKVKEGSLTCFYF